MNVDILKDAKLDKMLFLRCHNLYHPYQLYHTISHDVQGLH